jgi:phosphatidate cytidylyltransferase
VKILVGVVLGATAVLCLVVGKATLFALVLLLALIAAGEFFRVARERGVRPQPVVGFAGVAALYTLAFLDPELFPRRAPGVVAAALVLTAGAFVLHRRSEGATLGIATTVLGVVWIGLLGSFIIVLRGVGFRPVLAFGLMATLNDAGAFFAGRAIGKHPMAPSISPGKTWEGFAGGTIVTMITAVVVAWQLNPPFTLGRALILGALVAISAPVGDLISSAMKRDAGLKDTGASIPGHGGALDRLDSLIVSAPVFHYAFRAMIR